MHYLIVIFLTLEAKVPVSRDENENFYDIKHIKHFLIEKIFILNLFNTCSLKAKLL